MEHQYVHGYDSDESERLQDQAATLVELLHADTRYPPECSILEAGCGVGAQTIPLARNSPQAQFTAVDISITSLALARNSIDENGISNVSFLQSDLFTLPFEDQTFDHIFVCFVLEHLADPVQALLSLKRLLKPGGSITVIEGDHGSAYFYPNSAAAQEAIQCQIRLQKQAGGNALIGRELYPLLTTVGFDTIQVSPRMVYADASKPALVDGFTRKTFTAMIEGIRESALTTALIDADRFDRGIRDLHRTTAADGVFCYTFFKALATKRKD